MVEICRCANASFRVSVTPCRLTPSWPAIYVERRAQAAILGFRGDIAEQGIAAQFSDQVVGPQRDERRIGAGQCVLILRAAGLG
jgi:hypothetical protein